MDIISRISKSFSDLAGRSKKETLDESLDKFETKINKIVSDLIAPYLEGKGTNDKRFIELLNLLDPKKCNKVAMTMASNLEKNYTTIELEGYAQKVFVGQEKGEDCLDDTCKQLNDVKLKGKTKDIPKKELCEAISLHYVKILNLIAAILTAINPENNLCVKRLNDLFTLVDTDTRTGISKICVPGVSDKSILDDPGVRELIILYYFYVINEVKNPTAKRNMDMQFKKLIFDLEKITYDPNKEPEPEKKEETNLPPPDMQNSNGNKVSAQNIREKIKELQSQVNKMKNNNNSSGNDDEIESINEQIENLSENISSYQNEQNNDTNSDNTANDSNDTNTSESTTIDNDENDDDNNSDTTNRIINNNNNNSNETLDSDNSVSSSNSANYNENDNEIIEKYGRQPKRRHEIQSGGEEEEKTEPELEETAVDSPNNENDEMFGDIENNLPNNRTILTPNSDDMDELETKPSSKALKKFIEFTEKYQPVKEISPNVVSVIKRAFRKSDGTALTDGEFQSFCNKYDKAGSGISVNIDNNKFMKYVAVFKEMKDYYISTCNTLLDILESDILALQRESPENTEGEYKIRNIKYEDLAEVESKVRLTIGELYVKCNQYYYLGVHELYKALMGVEEGKE